MSKTGDESTTQAVQASHDFELEEAELTKLMQFSEENQDTTTTLVLDRSMNPLLALLKSVGTSHHNQDAISKLQTQLLRFCHEIVHTIVAEQIPVGPLVLLMIKLLENDSVQKSIPKHKFARVITAHMYGVPLLDLGHENIADHLKAQVQAIISHEAMHTICHFGTEEAFLSKIPTSKLVSFLGSRINHLYTSLDKTLAEEHQSAGVANVISPFHVKQFASWRKHREAPETQAEKFLFTRLQDILYEAKGDLPFSFLSKKNESDTTPVFKVDRAPKYLFDLVVSIIFPKTADSNIQTHVEMNPLYLSNVQSIRTTEHAYLVQISLLHVLTAWFMNQVSTMDIPSYFFGEEANKDWDKTDLSANPLTRASFSFAPQKVYVDGFKKDAKVITVSSSELIQSGQYPQADNSHGPLLQQAPPRTQADNSQTTLDGLMTSEAWKS
jgi:hypothetical protein